MNQVIGRLALAQKALLLEWVDDDGLDDCERIVWWEVHRIVAVKLEPGRTNHPGYSDEPFQWRILSQQEPCEFHETADRRFVELHIDDVLAQRFDESDKVFFQKVRDVAAKKTWLQPFSYEDAVKASRCPRERGAS